MEGITKNEPATMPPSPVQPPPDVGRHLLRFWAGKEHAEVERPQVLPLRDPPLPLHQLAVHDGDLSRRTPKLMNPSFTQNQKASQNPTGLVCPERSSTTVLASMTSPLL